HACRLATDGRHDEARRRYEDLRQTAGDPHLQALIRNDLAVLAAVAGDATAAGQGFAGALALDASCEPARRNADFLHTSLAFTTPIVPPANQPVPPGDGVP